MKELLESLASIQHDIWSHWMCWMFGQGCQNIADGTWTMPKEKVDRWMRQMRTKYAELSEGEKESDRKEAEKVLSVFIDEMVDRWHECDFSGRLHEFLGMTEEEYARYVESGKLR